MIAPSNPLPMSPKERANYGFARVRDVAYEAVMALWRRRAAEGRMQLDVARVIGKDEGRLSRTFRGPGNWTLRTLGELVEALDGEIEITVHAMEDPLPAKSNFHAYDGYGKPATPPPAKVPESGEKPGQERLKRELDLAGAA